MNRTKRATALAALCLAAFALAACTSSAAPPDPPTTTPATTGTTTAPATAEDTAKAQVLAMLPKYFRTIDELYNDPKKSLNDVYLVATDPEAREEAQAVRANELAGITTSGSTKLVSATVTSVDLTNKPAAKPRVLPTVKVTTCEDVSGVQAVDKKGKSVVPKGRKQYLISQLIVVNYKYPSVATWVVSNAPNKESSSCGA